jgi:tetratricopeptide (TPR) repeat protein
MDDIARDVEPLLADAAKRAPDLPELYAARGALLTQQGDYDAALASLRKADALNPNLFRVMLDMGRLQLLAGKPRDALVYFDRAVERDPLNAELRATRCYALSDLARFADAAADCDRARSLNPNSFWARTASGLLEMAQGHAREALAIARLTLRSNGDVVELHLSRSLMFRDLGMWPEARASYESLSSLAGDVTRQKPIYARLGLQTAYGLGGVEAMRRQIRDHGLDKSDDPLIWLTLAEAEMVAGDSKAARGYVDRAMASPRLDPDQVADPRAAREGQSYLLVAAAAEMATGEKARAEQRLRQLGEMLDRMAADGVRTQGMYELRANSAALRGDTRATLDALRTAISLGWRSTAQAGNDPYLREARSDPDIAKLFAEIDARNAADARLVRAEESAG